MKQPPVLEFTGERFTPECEREIWYEHMHRYAFAAAITEGRLVCDAACGEGYGTAMLRAAGAEAVGVDIDQATVEHARRRYGEHYVCASVTCMPFADSTFDVIASFETIEHLAEQQRMLEEFRRVLKRDGLLIISSPDKAEYSDATGYDNPDHVCELYRREFLALLEQQFQHVALYGQRLQFMSMICRDEQWSGDVAPGPASSLYLDDDNRLQTGVARAPMYWIALCSMRPLRTDAILPDFNLFADQAQSVYEHYNEQVRKNIQAGHDLIARDQRIAELERRLAELEQQRGIRLRRKRRQGHG